tara:strand:+ start:1423 stop:2076 length:654 start_codon:yes stop_codon:yes gene_type:complete
MAVNNHKVAASDGTTANPAQVYGGTFIDGGTASASPAISNRLGLGLKRDTGGTGPTENVHGNRAKAGTWAYQAAGEYMVRRMATTINGTANDVLQSGGSNHPVRSIHVKSNQFGANLLTAHRAGYWRPSANKDGLGTPQRSNWSTAPTPANGNYGDPDTGALNATADDAARPTLAIPGEFVILISGQPQWKLATTSVSGDGTVSEVYMKYAPRNATS